MGDVEQAAVDAFESVLNPEATGLIACIRWASHFAKIDREGGRHELVLDRLALLLGFLSQGLNEPSLRAASLWVVNWLTNSIGHKSAALQKTISGHERNRTNILSHFELGAKVILSSSVRALLPEAQELARETVKRSSIDLRHLLFAFVEKPGKEWDFLSPPPNMVDFVVLRRQIVDQIARRPDPGEDVAAWREHLPQSEEPGPSPLPLPPKRVSPRRAPAERDDRYRTQTDDPARHDALARGPFAHVLATRIIEVRHSERGTDPDDDRAFMVHLHGPWGSGKSSMLNLLQAELETPKQPPHLNKEAKPALIVWFNAWKHQRLRPPWWALMSSVYTGAVRRCEKGTDNPECRAERFALRKLWWTWRLRTEVVPIVLVALVLAGLTFVLFGTGTPGFAETLAKIGAAAIAALAGIYTYARLMIFGSQKAVQAYADLTTDPYRRIVDLFTDLVKKIRPPLVVFIDDLDRCDSDYVVELLEGIQTLFRRAPVTYVVAADRKWICSSFEQKYGDFSLSIGEPARPLGYLFLDKLFQISAGMPRLTLEIQKVYLDGLLAEGAPEPTAPSAAEVEKARKSMVGKSDEAEIQKVIAKSKGKPVAVQQAVRAAGALQITTAEATKKTEHRLKKLSHLLEPNPRSMKRLVNAVAMAQARGILEGRTSSPETRARWAMLSLRWPVFAEFIADNPDAIRHWKKPRRGTARRTRAKPDPAWPVAVQALHRNSVVMAVVGGDREAGALTPRTLAPLLA